MHTEALFAEQFRHNAFFIGPNTREALAEGRADYTPIFLSEISGLFRRGRGPVDVALIQASPPDVRRRCKFRQLGGRREFFPFWSILIDHRRTRPDGPEAAA